MATNFIPLDKDKHKALKVNLKHTFGFAKDTHLAAASIREYAQLASCMPIVFIKDPKSENYHSIVMLGVEQDKNLYWAEDRWQVAAVPMNVQRYPFDVRPDGDKLGLFIDENSDLIGTEVGEPLFTEAGEPSDFLKNRQQFMTDLANSEIVTQRFIKKMTELELLDELRIQVIYDNGQQRNINGIFSINEKRLNALSDEQVLELHKTGFLGAAYAMLMSLAQLNRLVELSAKSDNPIRNLKLAMPGSEQQAETPVQ